MPVRKSETVLARHRQRMGVRVGLVLAAMSLVTLVGVVGAGAAVMRGLGGGEPPGPGGVVSLDPPPDVSPPSPSPSPSPEGPTSPSPSPSPSPDVSPTAPARTDPPQVVSTDEDRGEVVERVQARVGPGASAVTEFASGDGLVTVRVVAEMSSARLEVRAGSESAVIRGSGEMWTVASGGSLEVVVTNVGEVTTRYVLEVTRPR